MIDASVHLTERNSTHIHSSLIDIHSHIKNLSVDLTASGFSEVEGSGLVGQYKAQKSAAIISRLLQEGKLNARTIIINGDKGTGKTALARGIYMMFSCGIALSFSVCKSTSFVSMSAAELFSASFSVSESLIQAFRKAIFLEIQERSEILEGEVIEIICEKSSGQEVSGKLTLKTTDMEAVFEIGRKVSAQLMQERIQPGDIISINTTSNSVIRKGRSLTYGNNLDSSCLVFFGIS